MRRAALLFVPLIVAACGRDDPPEPAAREGEPLLYVVNYPLFYFAERISGPEITVVFPVPRDVDPAFWNPDAATVAAFQNADRIMENGAGYAKWMRTVTLAPSRVVDSFGAAYGRALPEENAPIHTHGPDGAHDHGATAFTTWLDPTLAVVQADAVRGTLARLRPGSANAFAERFDTLRADLQDLDRRLAAAVGSNASSPVIASHPVYQYLARRYGLNLESVHFEPDAEPNKEQWTTLENLLARHPAQWMIWEAAPLPSSIRRLNELGIESVVFLPCMNRPRIGDYLDVMRQNAKNLERVYR